jgi:ADP-heptose:LPS heptosyltransferase
MPLLLAWKGNVSFFKQIRSEHYDLVIDLFGNPRSAFLTWISNARIKAGYSFRGRKYAYNVQIQPRSNEVHEVIFHLDALKKLDIPITDGIPRFYYSNADKHYIRGWLNRQKHITSFLIAIHCWGSWEAKIWGMNKFKELINRLRSNIKATFIVLWGPGEKKIAEELVSSTDGDTILAPETSLKQLGALLDSCQLMIANDSGPMHIAAALGTPTVGIFGPTNWRLQGPYGENHAVAYKKDLPCLGCNQLSCDSKTCMAALSVDEVMHTVMHTLKKTF